MLFEAILFATLQILQISILNFSQASGTAVDPIEPHGHLQKLLKMFKKVSKSLYSLTPCPTGKLRNFLRLFMGFLRPNYGFSTGRVKLRVKLRPKTWFLTTFVKTPQDLPKSHPHASCRRLEVSTKTKRRPQETCIQLCS